MPGRVFMRDGRSITIEFRASPRELAHVDALARRAGISRSRYVREAVLGTRLLDAADRDVVRLSSELLGNLRRCAGLCRWWLTDGPGKEGERHQRGIAPRRYRSVLEETIRQLETGMECIAAVLRDASDTTKPRGIRLAPLDPSLETPGIRSTRIRLRLRGSDHRSLEERALLAGQDSLSAFLRDQSLRARRPRLFATGDAARVTRLSDRVRLAGNTFGWWLRGADPADVEEMFRKLDDPERARRQLRLEAMPDAALAMLSDSARSTVAVYGRIRQTAIKAPEAPRADQTNPAVEAPFRTGLLRRRS